ncbi:MAG TPA: glycosyltransferase family 2 protein [Tepidisphaeraceae bacterium]|jgi:glycosyltransferase involved in cell wall biosynthesis|nr:glycosyltransferase family 2 protein [Tepidisphaeraceae bacterium]
MTMTQICCGIPVYNNAATIADVARRCRGQIAGVVVVDDGSTDADLRDLLKTLDVTVVRHPSNQGKGAALLTALQFAAERGAEYLLTIDGDGQHFPEDIPRFLSRLSPDAILLGSRETIVGDMPRSSLFGREFSDFWICVESGASLRDTQSGFRVYPVKHVLNLRLVCRRYNFEMEILTRAIWAGLSVLSVPVRVWYPNRSERVSSFRPFMDNLRISLLHARLVARRLLPIPHRRLPGVSSPVSRTPGQWLKHLWTENSSPLGLAAAAALSVLLCILLWPWGPIAAAYLALRWHLNKMVVLASMAACLPRALPAFCIGVGRSVLRPDVSPFLVWYVGSHIVAFLAAPALALLVYNVARRFRAEPSSLAGNQT